MGKYHPDDTSNPSHPVNSGAPEVARIREIQALMALCSFLPADGKLRQVLAMAFALDDQFLLTAAEPLTDSSPMGTKAWLESLWARDDLTPHEQRLVDWQSNSDNMAAALAELEAVEARTGLRLGPLPVSDLPLRAT